MIYSKLILHNTNWKKLLNSFNNNRLAHAMLFHGPEGSGKEGHALELAGLLNCNSADKKQACGKCSSCKKIKSFQHENINIILPLPRKNIKTNRDSISKVFDGPLLKEYLEMINAKQKDPYYKIQISGANTILINSIRDLKNSSALSVLNNEKRIILIFQAEKLCVPSAEAANALLKFLEEPPKNTFFILISSKPNMILDTIHSRCQKLYFPPISNDNLITNLIENGEKRTQAKIISRISSGNMNLAKKLIYNSNSIIENLNLLIQACFNKDPLQWMKLIDIISRMKNKDKHKMEQIFQCLILFFRDILYFSSSNSNEEIIFTNKKEIITKISKTYLNTDWQLCINYIEDTQEYILRNGYVSIHIICMFLNIQKTMKKNNTKSFNLNDWTI